MEVVGKFQDPQGELVNWRAREADSLSLGSKAWESGESIV